MVFIVFCQGLYRAFCPSCTQNLSYVCFLHITDKVTFIILRNQTSTFIKFLNYPLHFISFFITHIIHSSFPCVGFLTLVSAIFTYLLFKHCIPEFLYLRAPLAICCLPSSFFYMLLLLVT